MAQEARAHAEAETEALRSTIEALQQRLLAAEVEHEKGEKVRMDSREAAMELEVEEAINAESKDHADLRAYFESPSVAQEKVSQTSPCSHRRSLLHSFPEFTVSCAYRSSCTLVCVMYGYANTYFLVRIA